MIRVFCVAIALCGAMLLSPQGARPATVATQLDALASIRGYNARATALCLAGNGYAVQGFRAPWRLPGSRAFAVADGTGAAAVLDFELTRGVALLLVPVMHKEHVRGRIAVLANVIVVNIGVDIVKLGVSPSRTIDGLPSGFAATIRNCLAASLP